MSEEIKIKKSLYCDALRRAVLKYRHKNRETINEKHKVYTAKYLENRKDVTVECEFCKCCVKNMFQHKKTKKHLNALKKELELKPEQELVLELKPEQQN